MASAGYVTEIATLRRKRLPDIGKKPVRKGMLILNLQEKAEGGKLLRNGGQSAGHWRAGKLLNRFARSSWINYLKHKNSRTAADDLREEIPCGCVSETIFAGQFTREQIPRRRYEMVYRIFD